jgi:hypothetical protein
MMHPSTLFFALSALALANAAPGKSFIVQRSVEETLYITFWESGCGVEGNGNSGTHYIHWDPAQGSNKPEDCVLEANVGWQSANVRQPTDTQYKYSIDFFSGEGCNNPILVSLRILITNKENIADKETKTVTENGCYNQPEGQQFKTFRAHLL